MDHFWEKHSFNNEWVSVGDIDMLLHSGTAPHVINWITVGLVSFYWYEDRTEPLFTFAPYPNDPLCSVCHSPNSICSTVGRFECSGDEVLIGFTMDQLSQIVESLEQIIIPQVAFSRDRLAMANDVILMTMDEALSIGRIVDKRLRGVHINSGLREIEKRHSELYGGNNDTPDN